MLAGHHPAPCGAGLLLPILEGLLLHLIAHHLTILNGFDVDNPRNLVKSVSE